MNRKALSHLLLSMHYLLSAIAILQDNRKKSYEPIGRDFLERLLMQLGHFHELLLVRYTKLLEEDNDLSRTCKQMLPGSLKQCCSPSMDLDRLGGSRCELA